MQEEPLSREEFAQWIVAFLAPEAEQKVAESSVQAAVDALEEADSLSLVELWVSLEELGVDGAISETLGFGTVSELYSVYASAQNAAE